MRRKILPYLMLLGTTPALAQKKEAAKLPNPDCHGYLVGPTTSEILFNPEGKKLYFLGRDQNDKTPKTNPFLYEVDLAAWSFKRILSLRAGASAALLGHGAPMQGISVFDMQPGCGEGVSAGVSLIWEGEKKIVKSFPPASYKVIPSNEGVQIADLDLRTIKTLDLESQQKRSINNFVPGVIPLFVKINPPVLIAFSPEKQELQKFENLAKVPQASLTLKKGTKISQQAELFGIVSQGKSPRHLLFKAIKGWTAEMSKDFELELPPLWTFAKVAIQFDIVSGLIFVFGSSDQDRKDLRQVLVYSMAKGKLDQTLEAPADQYFDQVAFNSSARMFVVLSHSVAGNAVSTLKAFMIDKGEWRTMELSKEGKPAVSPR